MAGALWAAFTGGSPAPSGGESDGDGESPPGESGASHCDCVSQKCCEFACNPMSGKPIEQVPGIGRTYGCRLRKAGICKAKDLLDVFLSFSRSEDFCSWLMYTAGSNGEYTDQTYDCLKQWCRKFLPRARCSDDEGEGEKKEDDDDNEDENEDEDEDSGDSPDEKC